MSDHQGGRSAKPPRRVLRINDIASAVMKAWEQEIPLSVRWAAAEAADKVIAAWWIER